MRRLWLLPLCLLLLSAACVPEVVRHNEAGNEHFDESVFDEAIEEYKLAQVADPDRAEPYYNAANAYNRTSQVDAALAQTQQALKTAEPTLAEQAWYNLGNAFFDTEQWAPAIETYQEALRLQPDDVDAKHNLELALQKLQEQQQEQEQQEQSQSQDQQQEQEQGRQEEQQSQQAEATPTPAGESAAAESQQGDEQATPQPSGEPQEAQGMTAEQAMQLLSALLSDSETLQERLQQIYQAPGPRPEQDW